MNKDIIRMVKEIQFKVKTYVGRQIIKSKTTETWELLSDA
jgi:hypothetical protein